MMNFLFGSFTVINMASVLDPRFKLKFVEEADSIKRQLEEQFLQESSAGGECEDEGTSVSVPEAPKGLAGILKIITIEKAFH